MIVAVGCPVKNRAWILPQWFEHVEAAFAKVGLEPYYIFVAGTSVDTTNSVLEDHLRSRLGGIARSDEEEQAGLHRIWNPDRYGKMVEVRNHLLRCVREIQPDYFLSLDSDILLRDSALEKMLEHVGECDAIGSKVYLVPPPERVAPNYCYLRGGRMNRPDSEFYIPSVDVLMAIKLMSPAAYNVDYEFHFHGEDIGWSKKVKEHGLSMAWDGTTISKHVMTPEWLTKPDPRVGY